MWGRRWRDVQESRNKGTEFEWGEWVRYVYLYDTVANIILNVLTIVSGCSSGIAELERMQQ